MPSDGRLKGLFGLLNLVPKSTWLLKMVCLLLAGALATFTPVDAREEQLPSGFDTTAYALPDGSLPVICFGNGESDSDVASHCDDCLQCSGQSNTLSRSAALLSDPSYQTMAWFAFDDRSIDLENRRSNPTRAPPLS
jgi:hypothetical protein